MIALILGGAPSVWDDYARCIRMLGDRRHIVVAANLAGIHFPGHLDAWATLHAELISEWSSDRPGSADFRLFTPVKADRSTEVVSERWPGSSGLYALQVALFEMGAAGAILCGVPMETTAGHFANPGAWASTTSYRRAFCQALPVIGGRVRSNGGWTKDLFGEPTTPWLDAIYTARPVGTGSSPRKPMFKVENTSAEAKSFWHTDPQSGLRKLAHLLPGEGGEFDVDARQSTFQGKGLKAVPIPEAASAAPIKRGPVAKPTEIEPAAEA